MVRMNFILPIKMALSHQVLSLINLAAIEKTKRKNITELQYCTGMSRGEMKNKIEKKSSFFFNFKKIGSGGSVKRKIKKLWP